MDRTIEQVEARVYKRFWVDHQAINWRIDYKSANGAANNVCINQESSLCGWVRAQIQASGTEDQIRTSLTHIREEIDRVLAEM